MSPIYGEPVSLVTPWWWVPIRTSPTLSPPHRPDVKRKVSCSYLQLSFLLTKKSKLVLGPKSWYSTNSGEIPRPSGEVRLEKSKTVSKSRFSLTRVRGRSVLKGSSALGKKVKQLLCLPLLGTSSSEHYSLEQTPPLSFLHPFFSSHSLFLKKAPQEVALKKNKKKNKGEEELLQRLFSSMKCFLFLLNYLGRFHWRTPSGTQWDLHPDLFVIYPLYL